MRGIYLVVNTKTGKVQKRKGVFTFFYNFKQATKLFFLMSGSVRNRRFRNEYALVRLVTAGDSYFPSLEDFTLDDEGNLLLEKEIGGMYMVINSVMGVAKKNNGSYVCDLDDAISLYNTIGTRPEFINSGERLLVQVIETWDWFCR